MRIEVIHYQDDLRAIGVHYIDKIFYLVYLVDCGAMLMHANVMTASKGFYKSKTATCPVSYALRINFLIVIWHISHDSLTFLKSK